MSDNEPEIKPEDLELTEGELSKIFFGTEPASSTKPSTSSSKPNPGGPVKLQRKVNADKPDEIKIEIKTDEEPAIEKKPQGRPRKWTEEKIRQFKEEQKRLKQQRKIGMEVAKKVSNEPITNYERDKILNSVVKTRTEIEEYLVNKRETLKKVLSDEPISFFGQRNKCTDHLFAFHYFDATGVVVNCKKCSTAHHFDISEWHKYIGRNKGRL